MKNIILLLISFWALNSNAQNLHDVNVLSGKINSSIFPILSEANIDLDGNIFLYVNFNGLIDLDPSNDSNLVSNYSRVDNLILKYNSNMDLMWYKILRHPVGNVLFPFEVNTSKVTSKNNLILLGKNKGVDFNPSPSDSFYLNSIIGYSTIAAYTGVDGALVWAKQFVQSKYATPQLNGIKEDILGNLYLIGSFKDSLNLSLNANSPDWHVALGQRDAFITKLDSNANTIWSVQLKGSKDVNLTQLEIVNNEIVVGGNFQYYVQVDHNNSSKNLYTNFPFSQNDIFIAKYDLNGNFISAKSYGSNDDDYLDVLEPLSNGNLFISGSFTNSINFDSTNSNYILNPSGTDNRFYTMLNANYKPTSATQSKGYADVYSHDMASDGSIYLAGSYSGNVEFPNNSSLNMYGISNIFRAFCLKVNPSGIIDYTKQIGTNTNSVTYANGVLIHGDRMKIIGAGNKIEYTLNNQSITEDNGNDQFIFVMDYDTYPLHIHSIVKNHDIKIFPNPSTSILNIENPNQLPLNQIKIISALGQILNTQEFTSTISIQNLTAGKYIIILEDRNGNEYSAQFVKQ